MAMNSSGDIVTGAKKTLNREIRGTSGGVLVFQDPPNPGLIHS